jgi:glycosyltransferase involved in cell wall biosynthesis
MVRRHVPDAVLHVAGRPFGEPAVARLAGAEGVVAELRYLSAGEFAGALLRAACVVLPYDAIDQSGVLLAALALGRPVVVTDVGGFRELVETHGAGLVVPPADPVALAAALVRVLGDPALRVRFGAAALAAADGPLSWAHVAERHEALYAALRR